MTGHKQARGAAERAVRIALAYAVVAAAWVVLSDILIGLFWSDADTLSWLQTAKGVGFIAATALALFMVVFRQLRHDQVLLKRLEGQRVALSELNQFRASVIDNASIWISVVDNQCRVTIWNKAAEQISGFPRETVLNDASIWESLYPDPDYRDAIAAKAVSALNQQAAIDDCETTIRCHGGERKIIVWQARRLFDEAGTAVGCVFLGHDNTERRRAEQALILRERQLATLLGNLPGMAYRCRNDTDWTMLFVSEGCRQLCGYAPEALMGNRDIAFADLIHPDDRHTVWERTQQAVNESRQFEVEYRLRRHDGELSWVWEQGVAVAVEGDVVLEGIIIDITERKANEQELTRLATRDPLTGLHNRRELEMRFASEVIRAERYGRPLSVLWLDIDNFKALNDSHGHRGGDAVLRALAQRLQGIVRSADYVCRYGGEELVIVLPEMDEAEARKTADRVLGTINRTPFILPASEEVSITLSIGLATHPNHGDTADKLMHAADKAMYQAKRAGKNRICIAAPDDR